MNIFQALILGLIQGATEFIPVSSSGHLVLIPWLAGWEPPGLTFSVIVHFGTVFGILFYFWQDWYGMAKSIVQIEKTDEDTSNIRLLLNIMLGCIPVVVVGFGFKTFFETQFENPLSAAILLLVTAALLIVSENIGKLTKQIQEITWRDSLFIGLVQMLALLPGISRSGATIAAGRMRNFQRADAARFSFLLSAPLILGAGILQLLEVTSQGIVLAEFAVLTTGFLSALFSSYFVIRWLLNFLRSRSTIIFAYYCIAFSILNIAVFLLRS